MKKALLSFSLFLMFIGLSNSLQAQGSPVVTLFSEDFETFPINMTSFSPVGGGQWDTTQRLSSTGNYCDTNYTFNRQSSFLISPVIDITGYVSVNIAFDQICYLEQFDDAYVQVSFDGGFNWRQLGPATYRGGSFLKGDSTFSKFSRPVEWHFGLADSLWVPPSNTDAWKTENFDISPLLADPNVPTSDSMRFRFVLKDDVSSSKGRVGLHTWYIDNVKVTGATCELIPPTITLFDPFRYIEQYDDVVYFTGPYDFSTQFRDASTIDTAILIYQIKKQNSGPVYTDTVNFAVTAGSNYFAEIPNDSIQIGDTVCYRFVVTDASACKNRTVFPNSGSNCFLVRDNLPPNCSTKPIFNFPYYQTFNSADFQVGPTFALAENWKNGTGDFHDWWIGQDSTPTALTGPQGDVSPTGGGKYLYMEATGKLGQRAQLFSPCIDLYQIPNSSFKFYLNMRGFGGNYVDVDVYDSDSLKYIKNIVPRINGGQNDDWFSVEFNMYKYRNSITQLRFIGRPSPTSDVSDIALDSFKIVYAPLVDLRLEAIQITPFNPEGELDEALLTVRNLGVLDATSANIFYEVLNDTGGVISTIGPVQWNGFIEPNGLDTIAIPQKYTVPAKEYSLRAWIKAPGDERANNDTSAVTNSFGLPYKGLDFFDDFEGDTLFEPIPKNEPFGNDWELGTPNGVFTNSAFSGDFSWDINLNGGYNGSGQFVNLYTPFFDFSSADSMLMYFYNNREMETNSDGVILEYSLDEGVTWDSVRGQNDPKRKYWYNSFLAGGQFGGTPVFADTSKQLFGNDNGWVESEVLLENLFNNQKYALFRFSFYAAPDEDGGDGMSIDNFRIVDPVPQNAQAVKILKPGTSCEVGNINRKIRAIVKNVGNQPMTNIPITITVTRLTGVNLPDVQTANEILSTTILPRDRYTFDTNTEFDFSEIGDYEIEIVTNLPNDPKFQNDTMRKVIEHFEGCNVFLKFNTSNAIRDSSKWRLEATLNGRKYLYTDNYSAFPTNDFVDTSVCVKNGARVKFQLGDVDSSLSTFSVIGYDTSYIDNRPGGPAAPDANFDWICPPQLSARPFDIIFNDREIVFPLAQYYQLDVVVQNNGLDSLENMRLQVYLDNQEIRDTTLQFDTIVYPNGFRFRRKKRVPLDSIFLDPGRHIITAITSIPNGLPDRQPEDDTLEYTYTVIDTVKQDIAASGYCATFETGESPVWLSLNPYTYNINNSFVQGTPNKTNIAGANGGTQSWVTLLDSNYESFDSSSLYSPFIFFEKDSCYSFDFYHNYSFDDIYHDGGHVQYSANSGKTWITINNRNQPFAMNWYNTPHVVAIPGNTQNAGWTGVSNGYVQSGNILGFNKDTYGIFRWRFESDGSQNGQGWSIDDFCIQSTDVSQCFVVGLDENDFDPNKMQLGQNIPNPANASTAIPYYLPHAGQIDFVVVNLLGQPVYRERGNRPSGDQLIQMDVSGLADGVYYYWIVFENQKLTNKMVIAK